MPMDAQTLINLLFGVAGVLVGAIAKTTWDATVALRKDLADLQSSIAATYARRDDFKTHASRVETILDRIEAKLDHKADK